MPFLAYSDGDFGRVRYCIDFDSSTLERGRWNGMFSIIALVDFFYENFGLTLDCFLRLRRLKRFCFGGSWWSLKELNCFFYYS